MLLILLRSACGQVRHAYEDFPGFNLLRGNPVIIRDPGEGGLYPLKELVPQIAALRFYEKTGT